MKRRHSARLARPQGDRSPSGNPRSTGELAPRGESAQKRAKVRKQINETLRIGHTAKQTGQLFTPGGSEDGPCPVARRVWGLTDHGRAKPAEAGAPERRLQPALGRGRGLVLNSYQTGTMQPTVTNYSLQSIEAAPQARLCPVWNQAWVFHLAGVLFGVDWFLRRRWGLC